MFSVFFWPMSKKRVYKERLVYDVIYTGDFGNIQNYLKLYNNYYWTLCENGLRNYYNLKSTKTLEANIVGWALENDSKISIEN